MSDTPTGLEPSSYWTEYAWEHERTHLLTRSWAAIARVDRVSEVGAFVAAEIAGESIFVVRTEAGLRAFANVCRHRSSTLLEGAGRVRSIRCPYHLWNYSLEGQLVTAPCMAEVDGFDKDQVRLVDLPLETWQGWVFVNPDRSASPLVPSLSHLDKLMASIDLTRYTTLDTLSYVCEWNWKIQVENFTESYHHAGIHPATLQSAFPGQKSWGEDNFGEPWFFLNHTSVVPGIEPFVAAGIFPTFLFSISPPDVAMWFEVRPTAPTSCELDIHVLAAPEADPSELASLTDALRAINAEDIAINARTQTGLRSAHAGRPMLSGLELCTAQFHAWVIDHMTS